MDTATVISTSTGRSMPSAKQLVGKQEITVTVTAFSSFEVFE